MNDQATQQQLKEARADLARMRADFEGACKTVADMHAAATGQWGGPVYKGPVEDVAHLRARAEELREALIWASGSSDFGPKGQAHEGWKKVRHLCEPLFVAKENK
jgi:hypothetical protein